MAITVNMVGISSASQVGVIGLVHHVRSEFQVQMRTDLEEVFFSTLEFGNTCIYKHYQVDRSAYSTAVYQYIYDNPSIDASFGSPVDVIALRPQIQIPLHTLKQYPTTRDIVIIDGISYQVSEYEDDGVGVAILYLQRKGSKF